MSDVEFHDETGENDIQRHSCGKFRRIPPGNVDPRYKPKCSCGTRLDIAWNLSKRSLTREQVPDNFLDRFVDNDDTHDRVSEDNVPDVPHADRIIESVRSIEGASVPAEWVLEDVTNSTDASIEDIGESVESLIKDGPLGYPPKGMIRIGGKEA